MWKAFQSFVSPFVSPYLAIGAVVAIAGLSGWHWLRVNAAYNQGVADTKKAALVEAYKRVAEREKNDDEFRKLTDRGRCLVFMRDSGLPTDNCD